MIEIAPFVSSFEHRAYCDAAKVNFEEEAIGFKIYKGEEICGVCQIQFVGNAAYILTLKTIDDRITSQHLANTFVSVIEFLLQIGVSSVVYPIQCDRDAEIATLLGFDRVSETLFVYDFPEEEPDKIDQDMGS